MLLQLISMKKGKKGDVGYGGLGKNYSS